MPVLVGDGGANVLNGGAENDTLSGLSGADTLNGGDGDDVLHGYEAGASGVITSTAAVTGLSAPVAGATTAFDPGFLYIVEKNSGVIWRVDESTGARTVFLDIPNGEFSSGGEGGVLGLAFHPDYAANGRFFIFLTDAQGDLQVREYERSANPIVAEAAFSVVWETPHPTFDNHNGGWIGFSPEDGYLYIATGDGGSGNDPNNNAQNLNSLLGKILRIDVDGDDFPADDDRNYAIPEDNPFVGVAGADELWAYGLRNPWRAAFDPRNGDLYIGDVGQVQREEIDYAAAGAGGLNFGWRIMEGSLPHLPGPPGSPAAGDPSLILPIYEYGRDIGTTITGGEVYVGGNVNFVGQYVFADFGSGRLFSLAVDNGAAVDGADRTLQLQGAGLSLVVDFVTGTDGALYAIGIGGTLWRLEFGPGAEDVGDVLDGGAGADKLFGHAGDDLLFGGSGDDLLDGGLGADQMSGGAGDDTYVIDTAGDVVFELSGEGVDTVHSSVGNYVLRANFENLVLLGTTANGGGNALDNVVTGNTANNILWGGAGNDTLDGSAGVDQLDGGTGDDTYVIDAAGDFYWEGVSAGTDTVITSVNNHTLRNNVENLILAAGVANGGGNGLNNVISGNALNNILWGGAGNDTLNGGAGADELDGGAGDDTYIIDVAGDFVWEAASAGADTVISWVNNYSLRNNFENIVLAGTTANGGGNGLANTVTGNGADNILWGVGGNDTINGGAGADQLDGGVGDDVLDGGLGADQLFGDAGADSYVFSSALGGGNIDVIFGFSVTDDVILLDVEIFTAIAVGGLDAGAFVIGAAAADGDDRIIYDPVTGALWYDADGDGAGAAIQFASLAPGLALTNNDFAGVG